LIDLENNVRCPSSIDTMTINNCHRKFAPRPYYAIVVDAVVVVVNAVAVVDVDVSFSIPISMRI